ncbi:hypothetical protein RhiJN_09637 [Ceratobasidium sp. AG-Ba]|nr:hypothetical protein RhiJN_09637 [Ceratobasidium sp. AG-Ba]
MTIIEMSYTSENGRPFEFIGVHYGKRKSLIPRSLNYKVTLEYVKKSFLSLGVTSSKHIVLSAYVKELDDTYEISELAWPDIALRMQKITITVEGPCPALDPTSILAPSSNLTLTQDEPSLGLSPFVQALGSRRSQDSIVIVNIRCISGSRTSMIWISVTSSVSVGDLKNDIKLLYKGPQTPNTIFELEYDGHKLVDQKKTMADLELFDQWPGEFVVRVIS